MSQTVNSVLDELVEDSIDPRFHQKVERMKSRMSEDELARWLFDRGSLPPELHKKYGLNKVMSNVSASEIPEEAPDYVGDVDTAGAAGMTPEETSPPPSADQEDGDEFDVTDYNDLSVADLKATIDTRNKGREDDEKISVSSDARKADLVAALEEDDEYMAEQNG